jgi:RNA polymerase-interacting CarD/CdnL/TRCF family regulator
MVMKELINKITGYSSDLMEKHFPKGECKERGKALVFNAEMIVYVSDLFEKELDKAREEGRREALEQIQRVLEDEMLVIARDGTGVIEEYIEEWLSKLNKEE